MRSSMIIFLLLLLSCKTPVQRLSTSENNSYTSKVRTIILKITQKQSDTLPQITLVQKITAEGHLKNNNYVDQDRKEGCIIATFFDESDKVTRTMIFANPLQKNYEYFGDDGQFQNKEVTLKEEHFSIRIREESRFFSLKLYTLRHKKEILVQTITL